MSLLAGFGVLIVFLAVAGVIGVIRARIERHGFLVLAWRWLTGHPWHGKAVTDAGWMRPGSKALTRTGHASRFHHRPRLHRTAMRTLPTLAALALGAATLAYWPYAPWILAAAAAAAAAFAGWRAAVRFRRWRHHRAWVAPLHVMLAPIVGVPVESSPHAWLTVAGDRSRAEIILPPGWHGSQHERDQLTQAVTSKLAMEQPEVRWQLTGPEHKAVFTEVEPPPKRVALADVRAAVEKAAPGTVVLGLGRAGKPVSVSLRTDSPHVAASMGSGGGKSTLARAMLAPWLHNGGIGLVLDSKLISHPWVWGLPNCACVDQASELHDAFCWLGGELDRRNRVAKAATDVEGRMHGNPGAPLLIIAEELNLTTGILRQYWQDTGERGRSPALRAFDAVMFAGRAVNMHVVQIAQMLTARASGSGEGRENAGIRIIARATQNNWRLMAPEHPYPGMTGIDGRVHVVASGKVRECQVTYLTLPEARELALSGTVTPLPAGMPGAATLPGLAPAGQIQPAAPALPSGLVSLSEAVRLGILPMTLAAARTARHRDPKFPESAEMRGIAHVYRAIDLIDYARSRA